MNSPQKNTDLNDIFTTTIFEAPEKCDWPTGELLGLF